MSARPSDRDSSSTSSSRRSSTAPLTASAATGQWRYITARRASDDSIVARWPVRVDGAPRRQS